MANPSAQSIQTLSEFLLHAGTDFQLFDLGRGVHAVETQQFLDMENGMLPCPRPRQKHAWFAIVFWSGKPVKQHYVWFVKFPIDERGLLVAAARNHFLQIIVDALGNSLSEEGQDELPDNPYSFVPPQSQMAVFNALTRRMLNLPDRAGSEKVEQYVKAPAISDWRELSVQAVADFAVKLAAPELAQVVCANLALYQQDFTKTLLESAEPISLPDPLRTTIADFCRERIDSEPVLGLAALRALAGDEPDPIAKSLITDLLTKDNADIHLLSVVAGRLYGQLDDTALVLFFERAAHIDDQQNRQGQLFAGFFADLVQLPILRLHVLTLLRSPDRSEILAAAFGRLFNQTQKQ